MGKKRIVVACVLLAACLVLNSLLSGRLDRTPAHAAAVTESDAYSLSAPTGLNPLDMAGINESSRYDLMKQFAYAVLIVMLLGAGAWYFSRKLMPRLATSRGRNISVVENVPLGPNKMLHLVEVGGGRRLLVGSTSQSVTFLADVTGSVPAAPEFSPGEAQGR
ncbi:MAG: flagellar biosynthetic protein FliO [Phycisphaerae bacterium]|nr:flagellar biosynthetic protein FliO [Phycisphaerae bacterium]